MKRPGPADRFLRGRILMRRVLGRYLSRDPATMSFAISDAGKPTLAGSAGEYLSFNLSHAGADSVLAVAGAGEVGVDIEPISRTDAAMRISDRFYSEDERRYLDLCAEDRAEKALMIWCLKESIAKSSGQTVWDGLAGISLKIEAPRIDWMSPNSLKRDDWLLAAGRLSPDYIIAIALKQPGRKASEVLRVREYPFDTASTPECLFRPEFHG